MEELEPYGIIFATNRQRYFDTVAIKVRSSGFTSADYLLAEFHKYGINIRKISDNKVSVSFDELCTLYDLDQVIEVFINLKKGMIGGNHVLFEEYENRPYVPMPKELKRESLFMNQAQFRMKFSETNMMRYI